MELNGYGINMKKVILIFGIIIILLVGCDIKYNNGELDPLEMIYANCTELSLSYIKCDSTGLRDHHARDLCKEKHIPYIKEACK